jgi:hypothetical protein
LLVRVGIDSTDGCWNAPMRLESRELAYITITETKAIRDGMAGYYDEFVPVAVRYVEPLPEALLGQPTHLALSCWLDREFLVGCAVAAHRRVARPCLSRTQRVTGRLGELGH